MTTSNCYNLAYVTSGVSSAGKYTSGLSGGVVAEIYAAPVFIGASYLAARLSLVFSYNDLDNSRLLGLYCTVDSNSHSEYS